MTSTLRYAVITPARNEAENLPRLAACLDAQTLRPAAWVIVENGSSDNTDGVAAALADEREWTSVLQVRGEAGSQRGAGVVRALTAGIRSLDTGRTPDVVVNLDADVSLAPDYFERLIAAFASDPSLGIASGNAYELRRGVWRQRHITRTAVWGASRAYRWACLHDVMPLEERIGWDGIDEVKANTRGWSTRTLRDLPFLHHRREGARDRSRVDAWSAQGKLARYMGYRVWYVVLRTLFRSARDPAAVGLIWGYATAAARREPICDDAVARAYVRRTQSLRELPLRAREALGKLPV